MTKEKNSNNNKKNPHTKKAKTVKEKRTKVEKQKLTAELHRFLITMSIFPFGGGLCSLHKRCTLVRSKGLVVKYKSLTADQPASYLLLMFIQFSIMWPDAVKQLMTIFIEQYL